MFFIVDLRIETNVLEDPLFLLWRIVVVGLIIFGFTFSYYWRKALNIQNNQANAMNDNL